MKKKKLILAILLALFFLSLIAIYFKSNSFSPIFSSIKGGRITSNETALKSETANSESVKQNALEDTKNEAEDYEKKWKAFLATPISFYGKVIDESGAPIAKANVSEEFGDSLVEQYTRISTVTDENGLFHAVGNGVSVNIQVSKEGYAQLEQSGGTFAYCKETGHRDLRQYPDPNAPAVFILRKIGAIDPLIHIKKNFLFEKNGSPVFVNLETGKKPEEGNSVIKIETWSSAASVIDSNSRTAFDWKCRITVPGGGLCLRKDALVFIAPAVGYQEFDEINMPASLGEKWNSQAERQYFVRLGSGKFARINLRVIVGGEHFFNLSSHLNPSGSANLEGNPGK